MHLIYMIENKLNGKKYVGKSSNPALRRLAHFTKSHNIHLQRAIGKYGIENFEFLILQEGLDDYSVDAAEKAHISEQKAFTDGYNLTPGGEGGNTLLDREVAKKHSDATSKAKLGKTRKPFTAEHKQKLAKTLVLNNKLRAKPVLVEGQTFESQSAASRALGIGQTTINYRLNAGAPGYKYLHNMEI